jgi:hypothetical protein
MGEEDECCFTLGRWKNKIAAGSAVERHLFAERTERFFFSPAVDIRPVGLTNQIFEKEKKTNK